MQSESLSAGGNRFFDVVFRTNLPNDLADPQPYFTGQHLVPVYGDRDQVMVECAVLAFVA